MIPSPTPDSPSDVDLRRTRRTFLFAREQVAAQTKGYVAASRARHWAAYRSGGADPITDAPDSAA